MKLQGKIALLGLATAIVGGFVYSQIYIHEKNRRELREIAEELALLWQSRLNLSPVQTTKLANIIIEFTIRKNQIINSLAPDQLKILELKEVQNREYKNLQKIMTSAQFDEYLKLR